METRHLLSSLLKAFSEREVGRLELDEPSQHIGMQVDKTRDCPYIVSLDVFPTDR